MSDKAAPKTGDTVAIPADATQVDAKGNPVGKLTQDAEAVVAAGSSAIVDILEKNNSQLPDDWKRFFSALEQLGVDEATKAIEELVTFKLANSVPHLGGFLSKIGGAVGNLVSRL